MLAPIDKCVGGGIDLLPCDLPQINPPGYLTNLHNLPQLNTVFRPLVNSFSTGIEGLFSINSCSLVDFIPTL